MPGRAMTAQGLPLRTARPDLAGRDADFTERIRRLGEAETRALLDLAREAMVTRSRDLNTFTAANLGDACLVDCGDGLEFSCFGVRRSSGCCSTRSTASYAAEWRADWLRPDERAVAVVGVAYNVFETFRGGESAGVRPYARDDRRSSAPTPSRSTRTSSATGTTKASSRARGGSTTSSGSRRGIRPRLRWPGARRIACARRPGYRTASATLGELVRANLFLETAPADRRDRAIPVDAIGVTVTDWSPRVRIGPRTGHRGAGRPGCLSPAAELWRGCRREAAVLGAMGAGCRAAPGD